MITRVGFFVNALVFIQYYLHPGDWKTNIMRIVLCLTCVVTFHAFLKNLPSLHVNPWPSFPIAINIIIYNYAHTKIYQ